MENDEYFDRKFAQHRMEDEKIINVYMLFTVDEIDVLSETTKDGQDHAAQNSLRTCV